MTRAPACVAVASAARTQTKNNPDSRESAAIDTPARRRPAIFLLVLLAAFFPVVMLAQPEQGWEVEGQDQIIPGAPKGGATFDFASGMMTATNMFVKYGTATLMADSATVNQQTGEVVADGHVRVESGDMTWIGEHLRYNFKTHRMQSEEFRTGKPPVFAAGAGLTGFIDTKEGGTNEATARHVFVTTDDVSDPAIRVRASRIKIVPGKYVEMWNAVLFMDGVPTFYFPFYRRTLGERANNFNFTPGYRSAYGPYLLGTYNWFLGDTADGRLHLDYREKRGVGTGPEVNLHLERWGEAAFKYYYVHDQDPDQSTNNLPLFGNIPENRQQFYFTYQATPYTNLNVKAMVNYQTDPLVLHDFSEGAYSANPQPNTFTEVNKYWENWSLDAETTPRINNFFDQVERLPDVKLTGYRQQIWDTPFYYQSESSAGYYRRIFADTNLPPFLPLDYSGTRADTYQQLLLPWTFVRLAERHAARRRTVHLLQRGKRAGRDQPGNVSQDFRHRRRSLLQGLAVMGGRNEFGFGPGRPAARHRAIGQLRVCAAPEHAAAAVAAVRHANCPACCCCRSNCPITTTLMPLAARMSSVLACAIHSRPSAPASSTRCWIGT